MSYIQKKRTMKKLIFIFSVATIATISFVSCEKDNDKDSAAGYDLSAYKALSEFERANCYELGLSVFWGRCNLGTSDATEYGATVTGAPTLWLLTRHSYVPARKTAF